MRRIFFFVLVGSCISASIAQTASKPASQAAKPATSTSTTHAASTTAISPKIPAVHGVVKTAFSLRYVDYKIGTGKLAEPNKLYHVLYTGYLRSTGEIFDSSDQHRAPKMGKDGKPVMGPDGKPVLGDPQPLPFPQGFGRVIPGFDQGFEGMHVGGKRRIFIPWQLAYGTHDIQARGGRPGIPAKSDLVFDVELVDVTDLPTPPQRQMMPQHPQTPPAHPGAPATPPAGTAPSAPAKPAAPSTAPTQTAPPAGSTAPQPQSK
jgi:peptidylprolyl isomerase